MKKITFISGTRADYGKIKSLINELSKSNKFELKIIATGMHLLPEYGLTIQQILEDGLCEIEIFKNQEFNERMEIGLANTIRELSESISRSTPDLLVVHGDRIEALAGAIVGGLRNLRVAHIEGGEESGTIDGLIRHSISKLATTHFVANSEAAEFLKDLKESEHRIFEIGSPDVDIMMSNSLPSLEDVANHYEIPWTEYGIFIFHPVTFEIEEIQAQMFEISAAIELISFPMVIILPNNDYGSKIILDSISKLPLSSTLRIIPSLRFEYFLTLLKNSKFILGNSSAGVREAPYYGVPTINVGTRQRRRSNSRSIINVGYERHEIKAAVEDALRSKFQKVETFGNGNAALNFANVLNSKEFWDLPLDKG